MIGFGPSFGVILRAADFGHGGSGGGMPPRGPQLRATRPGVAAPHQGAASPAFAAYGARPVNPKLQLAAEKAAEKAAAKAAVTARKTAEKAAKQAQKAAKQAQKTALRAQPKPMKIAAAPKHGPHPHPAANAAQSVHGLHAAQVDRGGAPMMAHVGQGAHTAPRLIRRDPAPSRMAYRLQRLWLTPLFRAFARVGVPVFCVVLGLGLWLGDDGRRADLVGHYEDVVRKIQERPEFMVSLLKIEGASPEVDTAIRAMMPVKLPASSFQIDLEALHEVITRLDAVAQVRLVIRSDGTLDVAVTERQPAVLWRHATGIEMLDADGHRVATLLDRAARPDLPLIAGEGAQAAVPEAMALLAAAAPILPRARGMVRMGERRWDIVLDRGQKILLPQDNPVLAVERLLAIDAAEDLMGRDFTVLDLRNQDRPTIRLSEAALSEFRTIKGIETKVSQ